jgi:carboxyl-terminal processing protease
MQGKLGGIGTYLRITDGHVYLYKPFANAPATQAGLQQDDEIVSIDGDAVAPLIAGLDVNEAAVKITSRLRGDAGTTVKLGVRRGENGAPFEVTLTRADIVVPSVDSQMIAQNLAYIHINEFKANTTEEFDAALRTLLPQNPKGIVLDLRNNPGGLLDAAVGLSAMFLPKDAMVVYTEGRMEGSKTKFFASRDYYARRGGDPLANVPEILKTVPVVVMTNGASASASEIVAGALQDHKRATIMGTTTFGKGSVQNIIPLSQTTGVKLTTSRYYTPNGRSIQGTGIEPDVLIEQLTWDGVIAPKLQREKDLSRHLIGKNETKDAAPEEDTSEDAQEAKLIKVREDQKKLKGFDWGNDKDFLFSQALNKVKGLPVVRSTVEAAGTTAKANVPAQ